MVNSLPSTVALSLFVGKWKHDVAVTNSHSNSLLHQSRNLHIAVRITIRLRTAWVTHRHASPSTATTSVSSPNFSDLPWAHPVLHGAHCRWKSGQDVTLSTHLHPVPKLITRGAIPPTATRLHVEIHTFALRVINLIFRDPLLWNFGGAESSLPASDAAALVERLQTFRRNVLCVPSSAK